VGIAVALTTTPASATGPYTHGRLTHRAYAEIAGHPDEITDIKTHAASQGWRIVCNRQVGVLSTIRLRFPAGTSQNVIEGYLSEGWPPGRGSKVQMIYQGMKTSAPLCISLP
jgi:hypothetical protein